MPRPIRGDVLHRSPTAGAGGGGGGGGSPDREPTSSAMVESLGAAKVELIFAGGIVRKFKVE